VTIVALCLAIAVTVVGCLWIALRMVAEGRRLREIREEIAAIRQGREKP
jgi:uncharacterized membrane protein YqjE